MDKISYVAVVLTFFLAGAYVGAAAMRSTYRKHYGRALAQARAARPASPDPQGEDE